MGKSVKILVIKLGALGDFIQATGAMAAIRRHHPHAHITLLTTRPFEEFARLCDYFDDIWLDERPHLLDIANWLALAGKLNGGGFQRVYDLQNNDRTSFYLRLFKPKPEWVGAARGASHRNDSPLRTAGHAFDGHVQTLAMAGITDVEIDPLNWLQSNISSFPLRRPYVLLVPGCAPQHPQKRWPAEHYARLAILLAQTGYQTVIIGTKAEEGVAMEIITACPEALDLIGQTSLADIATLAREAAGAIGNDTGPMHLIAATGCPSLSLFSSASNPQRHAPKGENAHILYNENLRELTPEDALARFKPRQPPVKKSATLH